ncbi:PIG-L family deacetylase [Actinophytocola sp.]|uniref:PIG-L family deacetylase n=1 Tax=Actinophytocola sp. TaxID=1872138 RepID=UPI003D6B04F3
MATMVTFHAHPDDECIVCGGVMRKAHDQGHRVVLVVATRGELGEVPDGFLGDDEELWQRRVKETHEAAAILGAGRVEFLGYTDSGMMGEPTNAAPGSFWTADVEQAAGRLAAILREENADVLTVYDDHGNYGHPDHIQVHRVGMRAAELAGTPRVYEATMNRDQIMRGRAEYADPDPQPDVDAPEVGEDFGTPEALLTTAVDVSAYVTYKRQAMRAHASQIADESFFLAMPDEMFARAFGTEWFVRVGAPPGIAESDLFD